MLRYRADLRTLAFVTTFFVLVGIGFTYDPASLWLKIPLIAVTSFFSFACAVITHNTVHAPIFENKTLNRIMQVVLTLAYGHPVSTFVPGHNLGHHLATETARDAMRTSKARFRWNLLNQVLFSTVVSKAIVKGEIEYAKAMYRRRPVWFRQLMIESFFFVAFLATAVAIDWKCAIFYVFIPHAWAAWGIVGINFVQHDGCDKEGINLARNFDGKFVNWILFNNGYHSIHHIEPSLHWSLCPVAHAEKVAPFIDPRLVQKSLVAYCWRTFIWPGKRLRYDGTPVVLPAPIADEPWTPAPEEEPRASLGALADS
jgi:fatty acid desaturase